MVDIKHICDVCGEPMPSIKSIDDLIPRSATKVWDMRGFDLCPMCALTLDNEFLKLKLQYATSEVNIDGN